MRIITTTGAAMGPLGTGPEGLPLSQARRHEDGRRATISPPVRFGTITEIKPLTTAGRRVPSLGHPSAWSALDDQKD